MNNISEVSKNLEEVDKNLEVFAGMTPAKGMHLSYLAKAEEIMSLYGEMSSIMEEEKTPENVKKVIALAKNINAIIN